MNFVSIASVRYQVDIHYRVIKELRASLKEVQFIGISTDLWYAGDASSSYMKNGARLFQLIRPSGINSSWWTTNNIEVEFYKYIKEIENQVESLISEVNPDLLFIDDDTGPLEVTIIRCFKNKGIPVVLFEHGYGFALDKILKNCYDDKQVGDLRINIRKYLRKILSIFRRKNNLIVVQPFGKNNEDKILCLSDWTKKIHEKFGIEPLKLCVTGNPYYDILLEKRSKIITPITNDTFDSPNEHRKILICSSGEKKLGRKDEFNYLCLLMRNMCYENPTFLFEFRPKNEEKFEADNELTQSLVKMDNFYIADSKKPFYEIVQMYDVIISNRNSLIALECLILGVPVLLYGKETIKSDYYGNPVALVESIYKKIGLKSLELSNQKGFISKYINDNKEKIDVFDILIEEISEYFGPIDGLCGTRVAAQVMKMQE